MKIKTKLLMINGGLLLSFALSIAFYILMTIPSVQIEKEKKVLFDLELQFMEYRTTINQIPYTLFLKQKEIVKDQGEKTLRSFESISGLTTMINSSEIIAESIGKIENIFSLVQNNLTRLDDEMMKIEESAELIFGTTAGFKIPDLYSKKEALEYERIYRIYNHLTNLNSAILSLDYGVDEGGGAFYGPKIDLKVKDTMGREWQLSTVQFDFNLSERFDMVFVDKDGKEKRPFMIHRALLGSIERFFGVLVENFGGAFPVWLCPVQAKIIPVSAKFDDYAKKVEKAFKAAGIRVESDFSDERMNAKIRNAQNQKIPYMIVLGENEMNDNAVSIRIRTGEQKNGIPMDDAVKLILDKIEVKELP